MNRQILSRAIAELIPNIIRGVQLDFFTDRPVTQTQLFVLFAVRALKNCTMGALAKNMHVRMPTVTGIVDRLVQAGFVERHAKPDDRRQVLVTLTPRGEASIQEFQKAIGCRWLEVLRALSPAELDQMYGIVTKLQAVLKVE